MSFKFDRNPIRANFLKEPGVYKASVASVKFAYTNGGDYYAQITFVTADNQQTTGMLSTRADKSGEYSRLNGFVAATATDAEADEYVAAGSIDVNEAFLEKVVNRGLKRNLEIDVRSKSYTKKDGTKAEGVEAVFFNRLPNGPTA